MKGFKVLALSVVAGICLAAAPSLSAAAQISIGINIGPEPVCPYGYFDYSPYRCAPFGYYGPQWFAGGLFIGAGPWFHGPENFRGYVDRGFDPQFGYRGALPYRGERADWGRHRGWEHNFHGNYARAEHQHDNGHHYGQYKDHGNPHDNGYGNGRDHGNGHGNGNGNGQGNGHGHN